jgi:glutaminyl-tRNA synthetase
MREHLNEVAPRRMAVLDPVKLVIDNFPADREERLELPNHPQKPDWGKRDAPFGRELWIEREDYQGKPEKGYFRLFPGNDVRLRGAGIVRCDAVVKDDAGKVVEVHGTLDPQSRPGMEGANRKVKGTIHWVSARHAVPAEIRLYDRLFTVADPDTDEAGKSYRDYLNPESRRVVHGWVEPAAAQASPEQSFQFERLGYFVADRYDHRPDAPVFNRSVTLRDTWAQKA